MKIIYLFLTIFLYVYFPEYFKLIKNILQNFSIKIAYNIIYFYGVCQIKYNQIYNYTLPYLKKYNIFSITSDSLEPTIKEELKIEFFDITTNKIVVKNESLKIELDNPTIIFVSESSHINKKIWYLISFTFMTVKIYKLF
jgi:hypothetical protein